MFEDPLLCYYAADCFVKAGMKAEAHNAVERGFQLIDAGKVLEGKEELEREMRKLEAELK